MKANYIEYLKHRFSFTTNDLLIIALSSTISLISILSILIYFWKHVM